MNHFRFVWTGWDDNDARDYILGAMYNAVLYAKGMEENGDYMIRFRVKGGGVYLAYWEDMRKVMWPHLGPREVRAAHIQIGSPALKGLSWKLDYTEADYAEGFNAHLYWCPREKGMPYRVLPYSIYDREWCLYEGVYMHTRIMRWNPEGDDGKPKYRIFGEPRRNLVVDEMLKASKTGGKR